MAFTRPFVLEEAREMMELSAIAYAEEDSGDYATIQRAIVAALSTSEALGGHFRLVWLGVSADFGNLMFVARDDRAPARFAVVARGTDWSFLSDWNEDFNVLCTDPWPTAEPPDPAIEVARGSWDGLQTLLELTSEVFDASPGSIASPMSMIHLLMSEALLTPYDTDLDVWVTGHSLGGAMATILGLWLVDTTSRWVLREKKVNLKTYTFAAPTTGNQAYADYYDSQTDNPHVGWDAYRVFNEQDVVPHAYANLPGVLDCGIPMSTELLLELTATLATVSAALDAAGVSYAHVGSSENGTAHGFSNDPPNATCPPSCASPAASMTDFACWAKYEHDNYPCFLGVPGAKECDGMAAEAVADTPRGKDD